jgi:hypothetical protein
MVERGRAGPFEHEEAERGRAGPFEHEEAEPMVKPGRAALAGIQERGQALALDLPQIPRQDSPAIRTRWNMIRPRDK